jgi:hypothetical protein
MREERRKVRVLTKAGDRPHAPTIPPPAEGVRSRRATILQALE